MRKVLLLTIDEDTEEMLSLLKTLGIQETKIVLQKRLHPHKVGYLGPGRLDEIDEELREEDYDAVVINDDLKPSQHHYLEMRFQKECIDRTGIILRIFAEHAHSPEAIAQVTLAKLRYEQPFLREWIHKAKKGDRPGFLAGGGYATDVYYEHTKSHVKKLESRLKELSQQRELLRSRRRATGYSLVSLAGYTNAGKSALFNALSDSKVEVDERLFSTLATTTRRVAGLKGNVLIADTVGFIRNLPPDLVNAFESTLEEIYHADLVLLVFDASEDLARISSKLCTSLDILIPKLENRPIIVIGNKIDLVDKRRIEEIVEKTRSLLSPYRLLFASARTGLGVNQIRKTISMIQDRSCAILAEMPLSDRSFSFSSKLRETCEVVESVTSSNLSVRIRCRPDESVRVIGQIRKAGGTIMSVSADSAPSEAKGAPSAADPTA